MLDGTETQEVTTQSDSTETAPPISSEGTTTPSTPAPTEPAAPVIDPVKVQQAALAVVQDANRRAAAAEAELERLRNERNQPAPKTDEELNKQYYDNPAKFIRDQLEQSIAPLNNFRQQLTRDQVYTQLKSQFRSQLPRFDEVEQYVDQIIKSAPANIELTPQVLGQAYQNALGYALGNQLIPWTPAAANTQQPTVTTTPTPQPSVSTPPHRAPSPPAAPSANNGPKRQFTENERRLMREAGMTEAQWIEYETMSAADVARTGGK